MDSQDFGPFSLLLVDDEPAVVGSLKRVFRKAPYLIHAAHDSYQAMEILQQKQIDAALVDLKMPHMDGLELLAEIRTRWPRIQVVILTGVGGVKEAVKAIQMGAVDFLQKPFEPETLEARMNRIHHIWYLEQENQRLKEGVCFQFGYDQLIGNSTAILKLKKLILQIARSDASVLIQGETGTGKELIARAIHLHSLRKDQAFVPVDCASISESVMGSELFGHVKGAFTGAHESTSGLIRAADKGTLFLDEVGELPLTMQAKLLRAIQEKEVRPVGASKSHSVDVRFIAATNRNLEQEVANGRFRQDLYFRLNVVVLNAPPLSGRLEDLPLLSRYFIQQFTTPASSINQISSEALALFNNYSWPGNVRELENVIRRAVAMGQGTAIMPCDLPENIFPVDNPTSNAGEIGSETLAAYEMSAIRNALIKCDGHRKKAARMLGIGEATLYRKLNKYHLE